MNAWWEIHRNPLFLKSVHERLRRGSAIAWGLVAFVLALFIFLMVYLGASAQSLLDRREAAQSAIVPILVLQGMLLLFMGTGAVAHGVAVEKEQGLLDYQRLTPMSGVEKIVGYLFGLPIREYMMVAVTMPFVLIAAFLGGLSFFNLGLLYLVFFSSAILYHLTGLVAGIVSSRPRRANWFTRLMVIGLYLFLPRMATFGFTIFGFLTFLPTFDGVVREEFGSQAGIFDSDERWDRFAFFGLDIPPSLFTLLLQGLLIATFFVVLLRKWQRDSSSSLSKVGAVVVFAALQLLILGSLWPLIIEPQEFPLLHTAIGTGQGPEALAGIFYIFWFLSGVSVAWLVHIITPNPEGLLKGFLRARKLGQTTVPRNTDWAQSLWATLLLSAITAVSYFILLALAVRERAFFRTEPTLLAQLAPPVLFAAVMVGVQSVRQTYGSRGFLWMIGGLWVLPLLAALVVAVSLSDLWLAGYVGLPAPLASFLLVTFNVFEGDAGEGSWGVYTVLALVFNLGFSGWAWNRSRLAVRETYERVFDQAKVAPTGR